MDNCAHICKVGPVAKTEILEACNYHLFLDLKKENIFSSIPGYGWMVIWCMVWIVAYFSKGERRVFLAAIPKNQAASHMHTRTTSKSFYIYGHSLFKVSSYVSISEGAESFLHLPLALLLTCYLQTIITWGIWINGMWPSNVLSQVWGNFETCPCASQPNFSLFDCSNE